MCRECAVCVCCTSQFVESILYIFYALLVITYMRILFAALVQLSDHPNYWLICVSAAPQITMWTLMLLQHHIRVDLAKRNYNFFTRKAPLVFCWSVIAALGVQMVFNTVAGINLGLNGVLFDEQLFLIFPGPSVNLDASLNASYFFYVIEALMTLYCINQTSQAVKRRSRLTPLNLQLAGLSHEQIANSEVLSAYYLDSNQESLINEDVDQHLAYLNAQLQLQQQNIQQQPPRALRSFVSEAPRDTIIANQDTCAICLDEYGQTEKIITLDCSHIFHAECIRMWQKSNQSCPCCRAAM